MKAPDCRNDDEKLRDEVNYQLQRFAHYDCYRSDDDYEYSHIPIIDLTNAVKASISSADAESVRYNLSYLMQHGVIISFKEFASNFSILISKKEEKESY